MPILPLCDHAYPVFFGKDFMSVTYNYLMTIAYDGTAYHGWQVQPNGTAIQEVIEKHLKTILRHDIRIHGSGRTDAGVHASGQTAHFHFEEPLDLWRLRASLNGLLSADIRILDIKRVASALHARYSATGKTYTYHLWLEPVASPFNQLYCWHHRAGLNIDLLKASAREFVGIHDFSSFANEAHAGSAAADPVRTLRRLDIVAQLGGVRMEFEADGFLYKMVRNIVGTMAEVAREKRPLDDIKKILAAKDRRMAGPAAPPQGLFLTQVSYPSHLEYPESF